MPAADYPSPEVDVNPSIHINTEHLAVPKIDPIIVRHYPEVPKTEVRYIPVQPYHQNIWDEKAHVEVTPRYETPRVVVQPATYAYNM